MNRRHFFAALLCVSGLMTASALRADDTADIKSVTFNVKGMT